MGKRQLCQPVPHNPAPRAEISVGSRRHQSHSYDHSKLRTLAAACARDPTQIPHLLGEGRAPRNRAHHRKAHHQSNHVARVRQFPHLAPHPRQRIRRQRRQLTTRPEHERRIHETGKNCHAHFVTLKLPPKVRVEFQRVLDRGLQSTLERTGQTTLWRKVLGAKHRVRPPKQRADLMPANLLTMPFRRRSNPPQKLRPQLLGCNKLRKPPGLQTQIYR